jgi:5-methyltetrahydropteroyltriglutamate--homocysteine methyltransferase
MKLAIEFSGSFPRDEAVSNLHSLRKSGDIDERTFLEKIIAKELKLVGSIDSLGFSLFTDGMLWADDILNPVASLSGAEAGGLVRFFDNNFFVRAPIVKKEISFIEGNALEAYAKFLKAFPEERRAKLKAPIPGPVTLVHFSQNSHYSSHAELLNAWGKKFLIPLVEKLKSMGFSSFEVHEPSIVSKAISQELKEEGGKLLGEIFDSFSGNRFLLMTYFSASLVDAKHLSYAIRDNSILGIDLFTPSGWRLVKGLSEKGASRIYLGSLNSRSPIPERSSKLRGWVERAEELGFSEVFMGNNAPMDFVPPRWAMGKLRKLSRSVLSKKR